ncbi:MAG: DUF3644 domain-containing protein [Candidatus Binataceae bacterium]
MKKEARLLLGKAVDSFILSIDHFNRPSDVGRTSAVLILLDHSFEMLLKASILHKGGRIRKPRERQTIGFGECVRIALDGRVKFLNSDQALTLQMINSLRDAAQHHLVDISESQFYMHAQSGVTLFRDLLKDIFAQELSTRMPERVLPVSTTPPVTLSILFDSEIAFIQKLLAPKLRRQTEATSRLRALAIMDASIRGEYLQPSESALQNLAGEIKSGRSWQDIFLGVASMELTSKGVGPTLDLRLTKKEGIPVQLVREGTPGAQVVAVKRVNELDFYNLGRDDIAKKVQLTGPKTTAVIRFLGLKEDSDCYKTILVGGTKFDRYSQEAITKIRECLNSNSIDSIWASHGIKAGR